MVASVCQGNHLQNLLWRFSFKKGKNQLVDKGYSFHKNFFSNSCDTQWVPIRYPPGIGNFFKKLAGFQKMKNLHPASKGMIYI
jgi:hypothetical protein